MTNLATTQGQRAMRGLFALLAIGSLLVATHRGEFWPFSIYPMFSQAGRPWHRSLVREDVPADVRARPHALAGLPGRPFALATRGIPQIDFSEYIDHTQTWDADRVEGLRAMFGAELQGRTLTVYTVRPGDQGIESATAVPILQLSEGRLP